MENEHIFKDGLTQANIVDHFYLTHQFSVHGKVYSIQHYVIKFVSDLEQVGNFLLVLRFPPPIKLPAKFNNYAYLAKKRTINYKEFLMHFTV